MERITIEKRFLERVSKVINTLYGDLESGQYPSVELDEIQEIDERLKKELNERF